MGRFLSTLTLMSVICLTQSGCYLISQARGQIKISSNQISLEEAAKLPEMTDEKLKNLRLIGEVKSFAENDLSLTKTENYTTYYPAGDKPPLWVLTAARKNRLESKTWRYPFVGESAYRNYFDRQAAEKEQRKLKKRGYDTYLRPAGAYSTAGWFKDPIMPIMLDWEEGSLVATIIHELGHATVWSPNDSSFNEGFAVFVGRAGSRQFAQKRDGPNGELLESLKKSQADRMLFEQFIIQAVEIAERTYSEPGTDIKRKRAKLFRNIHRLYDSCRPRFHGLGWQTNTLDGLNNAWILAHMTYSNINPFVAAFEAACCDWPTFIKLCREAAKDKKPFQKLEELTLQKAPQDC